MPTAHRTRTLGPIDDLATPAHRRIAVLDGLPLVRLGFRKVLEESTPPPEVALVCDADELVFVCATRTPDVVLFELLFASDDAVEAMVRSCRSVSPASRFIAMHLGRRTDHEHRAEELQVELLSYASAARTVRDSAAGVTRPPAFLRNRRRRGVRTLSEIERSTLRLLAQGCSTVTAADRLGIPRADAPRVTDGILDVLGTETLEEALSRARQVGLVPRSLHATG